MSNTSNPLGIPSDGFQKVVDLLSQSWDLWPRELQNKVRGESERLWVYLKQNAGIHKNFTNIRHLEAGLLVARCLGYHSGVRLRRRPNNIPFSYGLVETVSLNLLEVEEILVVVTKYKEELGKVRGQIGIISKVDEIRTLICYFEEKKKQIGDTAAYRTILCAETKLKTNTQYLQHDTKNIIESLLVIERVMINTKGRMAIPGSLDRIVIAQKGLIERYIARIEKKIDIIVEIGENLKQ